MSSLAWTIPATAGHGCAGIPTSAILVVLEMYDCGDHVGTPHFGFVARLVDVYALREAADMVVHELCQARHRGESILAFPLVFILASFGQVGTMHRKQPMPHERNHT